MQLDSNTQSESAVTALAEPPETHDAAVLRRVLTRFSDALGDHRNRINDLNVYPVPDGDTGTNMSFTMQSVIEELAAADDDVESVCTAVAHGALMGARGNSGVIMAQILRGTTRVIRDASAEGTSLGADVVARALAAASDGAYKAVGNPVEGTILTVIREASEAALEASNAGGDLEAVVDAAHSQGYDALARTPEMLDVLAEAGVVDAGGTGLMLLIDAARAELGGHPMPAVPEAGDASPRVSTPGPGAGASDAGGDDAAESSIADLRYEVMFLLDADDSNVDGFKAAWAEIGDSIVVIGGEGVWNCHVHTDDIGAAVEAGIAVGRPHRIRVTDLLDEVAEREGEHVHPPMPIPQPRHGQSEVAERDDASPADSAGSPPTPVEITEPDRCSVVAVGAGTGVVAMLASLGAHRVVAGGQSMNPSTADLLAAVESLPTGHVVVLPNNSNIIPVAKQLDALTDRSVSVVPTKSVMEGFEAIMGFAPGADSDRNRLTMAEAASDVTAGQVTQAVRDAVSPAGPISTGDWLGIGPDGISVVTSDESAASTGLLSQLIDDDHELLTVITGADADEAAISEITRYAQHHHPDLEVEVRDGGQPLYPYYFGLE